MKWLLFAALLFAGCAPAQIAEEPMTRQTRNPPVAHHSPHGIPQVIPTTPREGLWSGYNQLGYQAKYGPDQRNTQTILKLDEWGPPEIWTVSLYVEEDFEDYDGFGIKAQINFGAGGSTQIVEIDWAQGVQISLPMNAVNVKAIFEEIDVATEGAGLSLGVQLARGSRSGRRPPLLTVNERLAVGVGGDSLIFKAPAFAKSIYYVPVTSSVAGIAAAYSGNVILKGWGGNGAGTTIWNAVSGTQIASGIHLPIAGQTRFWQISNNSGVALEFAVYAEIDG